VAGLPLPDVPVMTDKVALRRPRMARLLGRTALRRRIQKALSQQAGADLQDFLNGYSQRLTEWAKSSLSELESAFWANAGIFQAQLVRRKPAEDGDGLPGDILLLERWGQADTPKRESGL